MANMLSLSFGRGSLLIFVLLSPALLTLLCAPAIAQSNTQQPVEVRITAKQFEFDPRTITVQKGKPVRLVITSADVDHGFKLEAFGINQKVPAKKTINLEFTPDQIGKFEFRCSIVCGSGHEDMLGELVVEETPQQKINVTFDEQAPGVAIVEVNGERLRVDTSTKTWARIEVPAKSQTATGEQRKKLAHEVEAYDYRLVNVPTPKRVVKGSLNLYFTHRFSQPIKPLKQS